MLLNSRELRIEWLKLLRLFLQKCKPTNKPISSLILCRIILISFELFISTSRIKQRILYNSGLTYSCCYIRISSSNLFRINTVKSSHQSSDCTHRFGLGRAIFTGCYCVFRTFRVLFSIAWDHLRYLSKYWRLLTINIKMQSSRQKSSKTFNLIRSF